MSSVVSLFCAGTKVCYGCYLFFHSSLHMCDIPQSLLIIMSNMSKNIYMVLFVVNVICC